MLRAAAAALLALALAGCHEEDELIVVNAGAETVLIDVSWDYDPDWYASDHRHRLIELAPGGFYNDDFGRVEDMKVIIVRKSDGLLLFDDHFDDENFEEEHGTIEITVVP